MFDIFLPAGYPNVPPIVELATTGGGTVRFNANLYADGKVCLSLLGTWNAVHESEKWQPGQSTLDQVLLSIQAQIMTEEPYFNEPSYEAQRGTASGRAMSRKYVQTEYLYNIQCVARNMYTEN